MLKPAKLIAKSEQNSTMMREELILNASGGAKPQSCLSEKKAISENNS